MIQNIRHPSKQIDVQIVYNGKEIDAEAILVLQIWTQGLDRTDSGLMAYYTDW